MNVVVSLTQHSLLSTSLAEVPDDAAYPAELRRAERQLRKERRAQAGLPADTPWGSVGLALSGGGIRSATFCVGVLQALGGLGLLRRVDFLSTVSGGGYAGSFLGRMFTREWAQGSPPGPTIPPDTSGTPDTPAKRVERVLDNPQSEPLRWLRDCGRYMSPNGAGDTLVLVAAYLRNWVSVTAVLSVSLLTVFLLLAAFRAGLGECSAGWQGLEVRLADWSGQHWWWSPLLLVPAGLTLFGLVPVGWAYWLTRDGKHRGRAIGSVGALVLLLMIGLGLALWSASPSQRVGGVLLGGCSSLTLLIALRVEFGRVTNTARQRNAVTRELATVLALTLGSLALTVVESLGQMAYALLRAELAQPDGRWTMGLAALGSLSGLGTLLAFATRIKQMLDAMPDQNRFQIPLNVVATAASFLLLAVTLVGLAAVASGIAWQGKHPALGLSMPGINLRQQLEPESRVTLAADQHIAVTEAKVLKSPPQAERAGKMAVAVAGTAAVLGLVFAWLFGQTMAFLNFSSHQPLYSARLTRAYQGASNPDRWQGEGQKLGDTLASDDTPWADYTPHTHGGPLHFINVTLNETISGKSQIEFRDRQGLPMTVGPAGLSVGVRYHGLWAQKNPSETKMGEAHIVPIATGSSDTSHYHALAAQERMEAQPVEALPLGQWIGISGAAFTTGLGAGTSLGKSLLLGLANIRLGYWWDSHIKPRDRRRALGEDYIRGNPLGTLLTTCFPVQAHLLDEFLARFRGPNRQHWCLSDGGHFENTAAYELIRRRVPFIIICDCGCDPKYQFDDLAALTRIVRVDFAAEVEFLAQAELPAEWPDELRRLFGTLADFALPEKDSKDKSGPAAPHCQPHALLGWVKYPNAEGEYDQPDCERSLLVVLKPSLSGNEPVDVLNYDKVSPGFPQETTLDQYFDEAQWESYRKLGRHIGEQVFAERKDLADLWQPCQLKQDCAPKPNHRTTA